MSTRDDLDILRSRGHAVIESGGHILAAAPVGRLGDPDLEDLTWRSVAAHERLAEDPENEALKDELARIKGLFDAYIAYSERQRARQAR